MPPEIEHDIEEMPAEKEAVISDLSSKQDEADASQGAEQSAAAESSTAQDVSKPEGKDTLSIVRDVVGIEKPAAASSAEEAEKDGAKTADQTREEGDPEYSDVPFNKHPRFKEVLTKLKTAETDATRYRNVETFIADQGLGAEEAAELLRVGGLIKTDPVAAWQQIRPTIQKLLIAAGEVLPDDLKQRMNSGELTTEAAMEISRHRAQLQSRDVRQNFEVQQTQTRAQQELGQAINTTVQSWETDRRTRDPNFEAKMPLIQKEITWLQATEGKPSTPIAVQQQLEKAYKNVSDSYRPPRAATPKPAMRPIPTGQSAANVQSAKPKTTLEVIQAELAKRTA